jgi:hypothetical protein
MTLILAYLAKNWKLVVVGLAVAGSVWYVQNLRVDVAKEATTIVTLKQDNATLTDNNKKLQDGIQVSNTALDATAKIANDTATDFTKLNNDLQVQVTGLKGKLATILAAKEPTTCTDSIMYLITNAPGYSK